MKKKCIKETNTATKQVVVVGTYLMERETKIDNVMKQL